MKYLILENDSELSERLADYLKDEMIKPKVLGMASHRHAEEIAEQFMKCDVLIIEPTIIKFHQYNFMMMLMYDLITKNKLKIKEIRIFDKVEVQEELKDLWEDKRMYLDKVLPKVQIFSVDKISYEKTKLDI